MVVGERDGEGCCTAGSLENGGPRAGLLGVMCLLPDSQVESRLVLIPLGGFLLGMLSVGES